MVCLGYTCQYTIHKLYTRFAPAFKDSCTTNVSLQRDLLSKVQRLQRDLHMEVQYLMMLCIPGVSLVFSFVILRLN